MEKREIKFRIWNKLVNWFEPMHINNINDNKEELVWSEYTGLKDKNGKEIYEGDIVRFNIDYTRHKPWNEIFEVKFKKGKFEPFQMLEDDMKYNCNKCEVIGNIYENLELLEFQ